MTPLQRQHVEDAFQRLAGLPPHDAAAILDHLCAGDAEVKAEVQRLLAADAAGDPDGEVRALRSSFAAAAQPGSDPALGRDVGPYRILSILGEGGFGMVYLAERREPFHQHVALKIIKPGMDSRAVIARFEQERQALAVMDHPNVARVLDGGVTSPDLGSRPYFVMELVRGVPITDYCDDNRLSITERLELFMPVCEAIQHAHHKGIIHRDIKPSNILIEVSGDHAIPKVIDFGVAKAISHTLTEHTIFTEQGQLIGTPEYMSPEQAEMSAAGIDTRTDLYSLGVVLYELLTGALPFDRETLRACAWARIVEIIREVDPPRPSTRISSLGHKATSIAEHRQLPARESLERLLRDELDWITLKAMEKDRVRRYSTALELAADIRNYLRGHLVTARPPTAAYRARKFLRRHWTLATTCILVGTALSAALGVSLSLLRRANVAEIRANLNAAAATEESRKAKASEAAARVSAYDANIAAAATFFGIDDAPAAASRLYECPDDLRQWEWRRLAFAAGDSAVICMVSEPITEAAFTGDGAAITCLSSRSLIRFDSRRGSQVESSPLDFGSTQGERLVLFGLADDGRSFVYRRGDGIFWWSDKEEPRRLELDRHTHIDPSSWAVCSTAARVAAISAEHEGRPCLLVVNDAQSRRIPLEQPSVRIAISRDGRTVAALTTTSSGQVAAKAWDTESLTLVADFIPHSASGGVQGLVVGSNADAIALSFDSGVSLWLRDSQQCEPVPLPSGLIALSPDRNWLASGYGRVLHLINLKTRNTATRRGHSEAIRSIAFSPDSSRIVTTSSNSEVRVWDLSTDALATGLTSIHGAAHCKARRCMFVHTLGKPAVIARVDLASGRTSTVFTADDAIHCIAVDDAGRRIAILADNSLQVVDADSGRSLRQWPSAELSLDNSRNIGPRPRRIAFEPGDAARLVVAPRPQDRRAVILTADCRTGVVRTLGTIAQPLSGVLSEPGSVFAAGAGFRLLAWPSGLETDPVEINGVNAPAAIAISPDRSSLAVSTRSGWMYLAPVIGPKFTESVPGRSAAAYCIAWIDDTRLVSAARDGSVAIWATNPLRSLCVERVNAGIVGMAFDHIDDTIWLAIEDGRVLSLRTVNSP